MKTLDDVKKMRDSLLQEAYVTYGNKSKDELTRSEVTKFNRLNNRVTTLKSLIIFMETNPEQNTVEKWKIELENKIVILMSRMPKIADKVDPATRSSMKKKYEKEEGIDILRLQLKNLNLILDPVPQHL